MENKTVLPFAAAIYFTRQNAKRRTNKERYTACGYGGYTFLDGVTSVGG